MGEALKLGPHDRVLEIGTGSGYAAAVLAEIAHEVYTIERHRVLADQAERRLQELGYRNVHVLCGDGTLGWPEHAPFDAILVSAGGPEVPRVLIEQLAPGGRIVIPGWTRSAGPTLAARHQGQHRTDEYRRSGWGPFRAPHRRWRVRRGR